MPRWHRPSWSVDGPRMLRAQDALREKPDGSSIRESSEAIRMRERERSRSSAACGRE